MNRNRPSKQPVEKKPESEDFSGLLSIPKSSLPVSISQPPQLFSPTEVKMPETLLQTDPSQQEFERSLFSSLDLIPEIPYELHDYQPKNPVDCPPYFPQMPKMKLFQPEFMKNYDLDTLFYIFFYTPGTAQQFFAGQELKKRNWVYHKINKTWYHKLSEAYEKTDNYEIAKYEYFDHDSQDNWRIRQVESFKMEYDSINDDFHH